MKRKWCGDIQGCWWGSSFGKAHLRSTFVTWKMQRTHNKYAVAFALQWSEEQRMFQCIWFMGKKLEKFSNFSLMKLWRSLHKGGLQESMPRGSCPLNAGLHDVSIIFSLLSEGLFRFQDLVGEDEPPHPIPQAFTTQTSLLCHHCLFLRQEHPFPTGKLSNTFSSMVSSARINWCWCSPLSLHHYHNLATSELISCCKSISLLSKLVPPVKSLSRPLNTKDANVFHLKMPAVRLSVVAGALITPFL